VVQPVTYLPCDGNADADADAKRHADHDADHDADRHADADDDGDGDANCHADGAHVAEAKPFHLARTSTSASTYAGDDHPSSDGLKRWEPMGGG
jgi:hypothetical protein